MQNPPPGKQPYGSQTGSSPAGKPSSGTGLEPNLAAALSYIWIVGLIFFFIEKENKFIRFHAVQSLLFGVANMVIMVLLVIVAMILSFVSFAAGGIIGTVIGLLVGLLWLLFALIGLALFIGLIFAAIKAYQGQMFKLPFIGNMAENIVNKPAA